MLYVAYCMLYVAHYILHVVCCILYVVCCISSTEVDGVCCILYVVYPRPKWMEYVALRSAAQSVAWLRISLVNVLANSIEDSRENYTNVCL